MSNTLSKSQFKPRALAVFRQVERTGEPVIITDRGRPVLKLVPYAAPGHDPLQAFRGCVQRYDDPLAPVDDGEWSALT